MIILTFIIKSNSKILSKYCYYLYYICNTYKMSRYLLCNLFLRPKTFWRCTSSPTMILLSSTLCASDLHQASISSVLLNPLIVDEAISNGTSSNVLNEPSLFHLFESSPLHPIRPAFSPPLSTSQDPPIVISTINNVSLFSILHVLL